jgi:hypothetical protein
VRLVVVLLQCLQRIEDMAGAFAFDHLRDTALAGLAENLAGGAGLALAVGAAAVAVRVLAEAAAGLVAVALELRGRMLGKMNVDGESRAAASDGANHDEWDHQVSQNAPPMTRVDPNGSFNMSPAANLSSLAAPREGAPENEIRRVATPQNASSGNSIVEVAPAWMRARWLAVSGSVRSMKKRAVTSLVFMRGPEPLALGNFKSAASAMRHHI